MIEVVLPRTFINHTTEGKVDLLVGLLSLAAGVVAAFFSFKVSRIQMLGRPIIRSVNARQYGKGFLCLAITFSPGDITTNVLSIRVPGCRLANPRTEDGSIWLDQMHRWAPPKEEEYVDEMPLDMRLRSDEGEQTIYLACSPIPSVPFRIKCKTESIFLPIKYTVKHVIT